MYIILIFALLILFYIIWKYWSLAIGAGYDPTPMDRVHKMLELAQVNEKDILYDLGSGDGRIVMTAARKYGAQAVGIEADPFRYIFSWFMVVFFGYKKSVRLQFGSFFKKNLDRATVITVFLYGPTNNKLKEKFQRELKPGTRIVSYIWEFSGWEPEDVLPGDRIYLYVI
jgi:hypothetical protein